MSFLHTMRMLAPPKYWPLWLRKAQIDREFKRVFGHPVNWREPKTFNEKIQVYKVCYRDPVMHRVVDKVAFKDYIREKLGDGYTAELLAKWDRIEDVDLSGLTPPYVLKSNCTGFGKNIIFVREPISDDKVIKEKMRPFFDARTTEVYKNEFAYDKVVPCAFAEEYINDIGEGATDYKFFCFSGKIYFALTGMEHFHGGVSQDSNRCFYDVDWNVLNASYLGQTAYPLPKPRHLAEMKEIAEKLSVDFPFVRVDFYDTPDTLLLGEMTFYSADGFAPFDPDSFDYELGAQFVFPENVMK